MLLLYIDLMLLLLFNLEVLLHRRLYQVQEQVLMMLKRFRLMYHR